MNWRVIGFSASTIDGYLSIGFEYLAKEYLLISTHQDFCMYVVILADAAYNNHSIYLNYENRGYYYVNEINYRFFNDLVYKNFNSKRNPISLNSNTLIKSFIVNYFGTDGKEEFILDFENEEKSYYFKPEYPQYLNWVYMVACSFKEKSALEVTYIKDTYEIIDIKLPKNDKLL